MQLGPGAPTPPIPISGGAGAATARQRSHVEVSDEVLASLRDACDEVLDDPVSTGEAGRDWWPLAMTWALQGEVAARAAVVARPTEADQVAAVLAICSRAGIPVTAAGGRSGVCGASIPLHGGVVLDMCAMSGIRSVDDISLVVDVAPGTFGDHFEQQLRSRHGLTCGHFPQSMSLSTVGGWLACRGAGQLSTRYGKIEDMVVGLDVVLADGRTVHTGGFPAAATGPDLSAVFVGSEGTLGIITGARLRVHPAPSYQRSGVWSMPSFTAGLDVCRRLLRRGATPAVLRLYDGVESERNHRVDGGRNVVIVIDEGDPHIVDAVFAIVEEEMGGREGLPGERLDDDIAEHWMSGRNDVAALERSITGGLVVDTMEVSGPWAALPGIHGAALDAIGAVDGTLAVSAHCSHSYLDGGCLYFTFAGKPTERDADNRPIPAAVDRYYRDVWDAGTRAVLASGGSLSHHHGVGVNRGRYLSEALGTGLDVLAALKTVLDPGGILNPGKLGLGSRFGELDLP